VIVANYKSHKDNVHELNVCVNFFYGTLYKKVLALFTCITILHLAISVIYMTYMLYQAGRMFGMKLNSLERTRESCCYIVYHVYF
jgi:cell division protein FtsL